jgi:hypothetical protein
VEWVHEGRWIPSKFHVALCERVQSFLDTKTSNPYDVLVINTPPQFGKAMHDMTPVLTTGGWKRHGDLVVGDYVYSHEGKPVKVLAVRDTP